MVSGFSVQRCRIDGIPCKAFRPEGGNANLAVLAVHGFAGSKDGRTVEALARSLCPRGAAVFCFDFPGHGEHPAGGEAISLGNCADALLQAALLMREAEPLARKAVFATSFGGYMALLCLEELGGVLGEFDLVLKAPAVKMAKTFEQAIVGDRMGLLERQGFVELGFRRKMRVRREFLEELRAHDVCRDYGKPMLVVHGDSDEVVLPADVDEFVDANRLVELIRIPGADHDFKGAGQLDAVIEAAEARLIEPRDQYGRGQGEKEGGADDRHRAHLRVHGVQA